MNVYTNMPTNFSKWTYTPNTYLINTTQSTTDTIVQSYKKHKNHALCRIMKQVGTSNGKAYEKILNILVMLSRL